MRVAQQANRLAREKSPYLLQHARNPVDWYAWGEEAFDKARHEQKPIFLSIGYSTCHWCHVMAHESFENEEIAAVMNREFVNIKVDREERPDVDRVYMTFVQATTGHGGWPMSVWLTPDLQPFVGGTYFPPEDRYGHPAFSKVLQRIAAAWKQNREQIVEQGARIVEALRESQAAGAGEKGQIDSKVVEKAVDQFSETFDSKDGGFGTAPKFPRPVTLNFLLRFYARDAAKLLRRPREASVIERGPPGSIAPTLEMVVMTLRKMAAGGVHDHVGGGFHRYSVDRHWHVPHFEKMLYDQAQLAIAYLEGFQATGEPLFASVARDTLDYVARDMTSSEGGFFSAEDADSPIASGEAQLGHPKTAEGAFYVWTKTEIDGALGEAAGIFNFHYGVEENGNAPAGADPHGEFQGKNILIERHTVAETAVHFGRDECQIDKVLSEARTKLFSIRARRPRPHLDDKILAAWNGLMISAYARAAQVLNDSRYADYAVRAMRFLQAHLYNEQDYLLYRTYRQGRGDIEAFADDYAFVIQASLDLYEATFAIEWLKFAEKLQATMDRLFWDEDNGGYFSTSGRDRTVVLRMKDDNDSAEPAASSVAALNLLRLAAIRNDTDLRSRAEKTIAAFTPTLSRFPAAMPQMLVALLFSVDKPRQIVIVGDRDSARTKALLAEVHRHFLPNKVLLHADGGEGQQYLAQTNEAVRAMSLVEGKPAAYVCENFTCNRPVTGPDALGVLLN